MKTEIESALSNTYTVSDVHKDVKFVVITTPFLDNHNDYVQVYVMKINDKYLITDDGSTSSNITLSGFEVDNEYFKRIAEDFHIKYTLGLGTNCFNVETDLKDFKKNFNNLIQAILIASWKTIS